MIELSDDELHSVGGGVLAALPKPTQVRITCDTCQTQRYLTVLTNCCVAVK
jgi:hypothetical protein